MAERKAKTATKAKGSKPKAKGQSTVKKKTAPKSSRSQNVTAVDKVVSSAKTAKSAHKSKTSKFTKSELAVLSELEHLADYIHNAKVEIGLIRPDDVKHEFLPSAKDQLDAVVEAAADATNAIMDSCEIIESVMGDVPSESSDKLMDATTRIYEACSFQDITGQRINKVVTTMHHIEQRIDALMDAFGDEISKSKKTVKSSSKKENVASETPSVDGKSDDGLLEGPQLGDKAKNQAEIDDLLASFD